MRPSTLSEIMHDVWQIAGNGGNGTIDPLGVTLAKRRAHRGRSSRDAADDRLRGRAARLTTHWRRGNRGGRSCKVRAGRRGAARSAWRSRRARSSPPMPIRRHGPTTAWIISSSFGLEPRVARIARRTRTRPVRRNARGICICMDLASTVRPGSEEDDENVRRSRTWPRAFCRGKIEVVDLSGPPRARTRRS